MYTVKQQPNRVARVAWWIGTVAVAAALIVLLTKAGWWWTTIPIGILVGITVRSQAGRLLAVPAAIIAGLVGGALALVIGRGLNGISRVSEVAGDLAGLGSGSGMTLALVALILAAVMCACGAWTGAALTAVLLPRLRAGAVVAQTEAKTVRPDTERVPVGVLRPAADRVPEPMVGPSSGTESTTAADRDSMSRAADSLVGAEEA